jgi:hypothetical protein
VRVLEPGQPRALQQALMNIDRACDLPLLTIKAAEQNVNFKRIPQILCGLVQLVDGEIDLIGDEKVEPDDVVERFRDPAPIDQAAGSKFVAFPRLADGLSKEERNERGEERVVIVQNSSVRHRLCR